MSYYYSNGKLLISGEYVVLDGALSLAIPTKLGQSLEVKNAEDSKITWQSLDCNGNIWFENTFTFDEVVLGTTNHDNEILKRLLQILNAAKKLNPHFLDAKHGIKVITKLDFPRDWGLGSSSTLINNIAQWAKIDAFKLLKNTFGGSGYDIACAQHNTPITYQLLNASHDITKNTNNNKKHHIKEVKFNPLFKDKLYFVHLNKKQNSRDGIKKYHASKGSFKNEITAINNITNKLIEINLFEDFENSLVEHESIIAKVTKQNTVKTTLFNDFKGSIKSLGAWGGDFILATSNKNPAAYFKSKGFETIIPYNDMVL